MASDDFNRPHSLPPYPESMDTSQPYPIRIQPVSSRIQSLRAIFNPYPGSWGRIHAVSVTHPMRICISSFGQMIIAAIDALNEKLGSNKTSISKFIESKYQNLPAGHSTLLRHHLNRMKDTGDLIFWKNNYMKPDPNFIRRGRGRPPKPKEPGMPTSSSGSARPRGRPKKDEFGADILDPAAASATLPKKQKVNPSNNFDGSLGIGANTKTGRPRGRPPKVKPQLGGEGVSA